MTPTISLFPSPPSCYRIYTFPWYTVGSIASGIILTYERCRPPAIRGRARRRKPQSGVTQNLAHASIASETFITKPAMWHMLSMKEGGTVQVLSVAPVLRAISS